MRVRLRSLALWGMSSLLLVGMLGYSYWSYTSIKVLSKRVHALQEGVHSLESKTSEISESMKEIEERLSTSEIDILLLQEGSIDLTKTIYQPIESGFSIDVQSVSKHLTGVKITGTVLNHSSVVHEQAKFRVSIGSKSNEFIVPRLRAGYAAKFSVYIPDVEVKNARYAKFDWYESLLRYYKE